MKEKIKKYFYLIAGFSISLTIIMATYIYYNIYKSALFHSIQTEATVLVNGIKTGENIEEMVQQEVSLRVTWIQSNGKVLFDNQADYRTMENHKNRPEVKEAMQDGEGKSVRESDTLEINTYYYAYEMKDGTILRVARQGDSFFSYLVRALPILMASFVVTMLMTTFLANYLVKDLIDPIEDMAKHMDNIGSEQVYSELVPFARIIKSQHESVLKNATMRQDFTANVSHELKTPLTAITGYADLIESGMAKEEDVIRFAGEIRKQSQRLLGLINDTIRLSEMDNSSIAEEYEYLDLYELGELCLKRLEMNAAARDITLCLDGRKSYIYANRGMMEELISNLCDNSIRYTNPGGRVSLGINHTVEETILTVKDNGIGIPKEHQEHVFERFYRVDKSRSTKTGGTGLGLAIVKHIVEKHEAKIELESETGKGTIVTVRFQNTDKG